MSTAKSGLPRLLHATSAFAFMTFLSRIMGLVRDILIAQVFGSSAGVDAFLVAFKIPNFMRRLFAEGAFSQAFVPILSEYQQTRSEQEVRQLIQRTGGVLAGSLALVTAVAMIFAPLMISVFAPGFAHDPLRHALASSMLRVTFPYLFFIALTAFVAAILNTYGYFAAAAFAPVLLNVCLITAALVVAPHLSIPVTALAWGVFVAGIIQLLFLLPFLKRIGKFVWPVWYWRDSGVQRILKQMVPALFGVSVAQINLLIDTIFASFLPVGSISWLYYSDRINSFPLGVFGVAIATVVLPHLSRQHAAKSPAQFQHALDWGVRMVMFIALPAAAGIFVLAAPILASLLHYGKFSGHDVHMASLSLMGFSLGILGFMLTKLFASAFYATQNIKTPVRIAAISLVANTSLSLCLIFPLQHAGLALSLSLAAYVNSGLLFYGLLKRKIYRPSRQTAMTFLRIVLACSAMAIVLYMLRGSLTLWLQQSSLWRLMHLTWYILLAVIIYFSVLLLSGWRFRHLRLQGVA